MTLVHASHLAPPAEFGVALVRLDLGAEEAGPENALPPVRIFVGTEPAQARPERALVWSILKQRNRARRYEIHLMRQLAGFRRLGWATSFTNYRFAVPHLAGRRGRAIYNDVDMIYLRDPALLFDLPLGGCGYLAISDTETSTMLLDCERMAACWPLEQVQRRQKGVLTARAARAPGLRGPLDPGWNQRDEDEYDPSTANLYHFTTLHTQPWRPFPERFVYHEHPHAELWLSLEREADAAGFQVFGRDCPSAGFASGAPLPAAAPGPASHGAWLRQLMTLSGVRDAWAFADGASASRPSASELALASLEPAELRQLAAPEAAAPRDAVLCLSGLDSLPDDDVPWVVAELFRRARRLVFASAVCRKTRRRPPWLPPAGGVRGRDWWLRVFRAASALRPEVHWELALLPEGRPSGEAVRFLSGGPRLGAAPPRVWVLHDGTPGSREPALALARALAWPWEEKPLRTRGVGHRSRRLLGSGLCNWMLGASLRELEAGAEAPLLGELPDLVISSGSAAAPVARALRERSRWRTRLVQLDGDAASPTLPFDLVLTPASLAALRHPDRLELAVPLREAAAPEATPRASEEPPRRQLGILLAGPRKADAAALAWISGVGETLAKVASESRAGCVVAAGDEVPQALLQGLLERLPGATELPRWSALTGRRESFDACLERADVLVAACEADADLSRICAAGKPVLLAAPAPRQRPLPERLRAWLAGAAFARPENDRGTTRPQLGLELLFSRLLASGIATPAPDFLRRQQLLIASGLARPLGEELGAPARPAAGELSRVVERVGGLVDPGPWPAHGGGEGS